MTSPALRAVRVSLLVPLIALGLPAARAHADVCVSVDEAHDMFSARDREAALLLLQRQFEFEGARVVSSPCQAEYVLTHVQLGPVINITLSGPTGRREATAMGMEDVPAVYSQMVRSLLRGVPMTAAGVVDRTNVSRTQSEKRRVSSDSLAYARLGYTGIFAGRAYGGPSMTLFGYRKELDSFALDVSFLNFSYQTGSSDYGYGYARSGSTNGTWLKLEALHFKTPLSNRSAYFGGGLSWTTVDLNNSGASWSGNGLQGELTIGYEFERASTLRTFFQADAGLPCYRLRSERTVYSNTSPYISSTTGGRRYAPSVSLSLGFGWQRGGGK
jgi:hypothetical protein